jgi:hypothetical protein
LINVCLTCKAWIVSIGVADVNVASELLLPQNELSECEPERRSPVTQLTKQSSHEDRTVDDCAAATLTGDERNGDEDTSEQQLSASVEPEVMPVSDGYATNDNSGNNHDNGADNNNDDVDSDDGEDDGGAEGEARARSADREPMMPPKQAR